jgi:hypothetical protein
MRNVPQLIGLAALLITTCGAADSDVKPSSWMIDWREPRLAVAGRALDLAESNKSDFVNMLLMETPGGQRVILRQTILGPEGCVQFRWQDDETGWWIEIVQATQLHSKDLWDYFKTNFDRLAMKPEHLMKFSAATRGGLRFSTEVPVREAHQQEGFGGLLHALERAGLRERLLAEYPPGVREATDFVSTLNSNEQGAGAAVSFVTLGVFLRSVAGASEAQPYAAAIWQAKRGLASKTASPTEDQARAFAAQFKSIDPADPLRGFHVEELRLSKINVARE